MPLLSRPSRAGVEVCVEAGPVAAREAYDPRGDFAMRTLSSLFALTCLLLLAPGVVRADVPKGWHASLGAGVEAAAKSGKPILLITAWKRKL